MSNRLPPISGEWIDRSQRIDFTFEGNRFWGYAGDTIASALWAAGQRVLGRSFKYHRPRGILSLASHDINALMQNGQQLNVRADITPLEAGMSLYAVNTNGGVMGDCHSILDFFSPLLPVGFYYKAFHHKRLFPFWERTIRNLSGLGKVDVATPHIRTAKQYDFCDVLVIGAGVAGLSAALAAADAGANVAIVDENARAGGSGAWMMQTNELVEAVKNCDRIRLYTETVAAAYYADNWIPLVDRERLTKMRAKTVIMANGAYEQPAVFRNNDSPGVMLASAAQRLIYRYAVKPMQRAVVLTANSDGYQAALDLAKHGIEVKAIADLRPTYTTNPTTQALQALGIPIFTSHCIYAAKTNPASDGVSGAVICPLDANGKPQTEFKQAIACDGIMMSVGWAGAANLLYQAGTKMRFDDSLQQFVPDRLPAGVFACGRVNGVYEFDRKLLDGRRAGLEAAAFLGLTKPVDCAVTPSSESPSHPWAIVEHPAGKNFVDFDEDLQFKDFPNAIQEGFDNIELLKRFTTVGMGPSQGKHSNMNALRILARITGKSPAEVGTTTARPFFHPVPLSHLAGRGFTPERYTPLHSRHAALGAEFMLAGAWRRPEYYTRPGKSREDCIRAEVIAVRTRVGAIDVGTLGKLELRGADAAEFLERVYTGRYGKLKLGMSRYALMLDETGVIIDDGVMARLGTEHFYFTTTTSGAATIYRELSRLNTMWGLDCGLVNLTGARSAINLAGIYARDVLAQLTDCDLSSAAFPYLAVREALVAGIEAILIRVGFVGEWGYEIHVAAESAAAIWDALFAAGKTYGIAPFGVEAQRLLRLEKGHLIVGQDTDALTTPREANLGWAVKLDKPFFIGQRSLQAIAKQAIAQKLVGFTLDPNFQGTAPQECHLIIDRGEIAGRVTSIAFSPVLKRYIGLAYVKPELAAIGDRISIRLSDGAIVTATVSPTPFYDPENQRQQETAQPQEAIV
ncbi:2Fe-2S iron-sulfur cluster-binding protein [Scytonema millei]|uniref:FAD-dependent oxidoreductase n=1 Tax=Scytonema millei VB511283 TaxID=1245923 RepID=A0A9X5EA44_9CYAN|nr:2Fe-2S iron-sulfur cluster-binding protein [Scytonema millei]NHC38066.1 FAD-dependent oxidoreductase [Scytonema millei VB511283]